MNLTHLQLLSVPVTDQDRARDFYTGTLGFELIADVQMGRAGAGSRSASRAGRPRSPW
jgi:catechol 2,3-dioxygenase-like lactoylglutathione lyase family enzyme